MRFSPILAIPAFVPLAVALALPVLHRQSFPLYHVTNYTTGCSPAGCTYSFDICYTSPGCSSSTQVCEPSFETHCSGTDIQNGMAPCDNAEIFTNEVPGNSNVTLMVQHQWDQDVTTGSGGDDGRFNSLANHTIMSGVGTVYQGAASFDISVTEETGVA